MSALLRRPPGLPFSLLTLGWAALAPVSSAAAGTFTVTVTTDSADGACDTHCSLREAISAANAAGGEDLVIVPEGTFTLSLGPADEDTNAGGDVDVLGPVTITGAGGADRPPAGTARRQRRRHADARPAARLSGPRRGGPGRSALGGDGVRGHRPARCAPEL